MRFSTQSLVSKDQKCQYVYIIRSDTFIFNTDHHKFYVFLVTFPGLKHQLHIKDLSSPTYTPQGKNVSTENINNNMKMNKSTLDSPARLGDDHFRAERVELTPQVARLQADLDVLVALLALGRRQHPLGVVSHVEAAKLLRLA